MAIASKDTGKRIETWLSPSLARELKELADRDQLMSLGRDQKRGRGPAAGRPGAAGMSWRPNIPYHSLEEPPYEIGLSAEHLEGVDAAVTRQFGLDGCGTQVMSGVTYCLAHRRTGAPVAKRKYA